ncbi:DUF3558 family protein [Rhodococcus sp. BP22]|uniref:DUF3558 family protein n=1 Tax=Rhodococcus sp. BP22 TaxID=2758566 RepID=UPI001648654E|nr:DUF3558 family protein [Rhodococcus sp. BP22]
MRKKLAVVACCLLVLSGCARSVEGKAVVEDPWHGQGQSSSATPPTTEAVTSVEFDPCDLDEITLTIAVGVDPKTVVPMSGGCVWTGEDVAFTATIQAGLPLDSIEGTAGVTDLTYIDVGTRRVQIFAYKGDSCVAVVDIDGRALQLTMMEKDFSSFCIRLSVAARILVEDI